MEVTGRVKLINPEQQVSASFRKREMVVTTEEQYPQHIMIEFAQDKCDLLNSYKPNDEVKVSINLRGREWVNPQGETRYFNSIQGWRIERVGQPQAAAQAFNSEPQSPQGERPAFEQAGDLSSEEHDDLPF